MQFQDIETELQQIKNELKYPTIAVIGKAGVGKSTLINEIFGLNIPTGAGKSHTREYNKYPDSPNEDKPIFLYDSPGYEASETELFLDKTINFLKTHSFKESNDEYPTDDHINLVWYIISGKRFEDFDETVIKTIIKQGLPLIVVISQVDILREQEKNDLKKTIESFLEHLHQDKDLDRELCSKISILEVAAFPIRDKNEEDEKKLKKLVDKSIELLPEIYANAFIYAQEKNIKAKKKPASMIIVVAALTVFGSSFVPIPGSTPAFTLATQTSLLRELETIYGFQKYSQEVTKNLHEKTLVIIAGSILDITSFVVGALFPAIFMVGEAVAGAIAASYILAIAFAYTDTLEDTTIKYLKSNPTRDLIIEYMEERFKLNLEKYSRLRVSTRQDIIDFVDDFQNA